MVVGQGSPPREIGGVNTQRRLNLQQVRSERENVLQRGDPVGLANLPPGGIFIDRMKKGIGNLLTEAELPGEVIGGIQLEALFIIGELKIAARSCSRENGLGITVRVRAGEEAR